MEKNDIYELSQLLGNQNGLENDFSQIITTLKDTPIQFDTTTRMTGLLITLALANVI